MSDFEWLMDVRPDIAVYLSQNLGGRKLYIPANLDKNTDIFIRISHLKKAGYSKEQIITSLINEFEISKRTAERKIKEFYEKNENDKI